jgi:phosphate transport system substrate-binding protein
VLAEISFRAETPEAVRALLADMQADLVVSRFAPAGSTARVLALDALVPIASPDNPAPRISSADLARALSGEVDNWAQIGGPDMPLVLHGLSQGSDLAAAIAARLGQTPEFQQTHADLAALAAAVARDPWALGVTGAAEVGPARALDLTDSCGFVLRPDFLSVKAEDYPLTLPIYLQNPPRRLPLLAREFSEFLAMPAAGAVISQAGFVSRESETAPLVDGARLINAINAGSDLDTLQRLAGAMQGATRASLTFRFDADSNQLDAVSQENLRDLAQAIEAGQFAGSTVQLVGFGADVGSSIARANDVLAALQVLAPDIMGENLPTVDAFGAALPMACDTTRAGKRLNARVEVWLRAQTSP